METPNLPSPEALARKFCEVLRQHLSAHELASAIMLNRNEESPNVCHTHDFCDANMTMLAAMESFGVVYESAAEQQDFCRVWNEAWMIAKASEFRLGLPLDCRPEELECHPKN